MPKKTTKNLPTRTTKAKGTANARPSTSSKVKGKAQAPAKGKGTSKGKAKGGAGAPGSGAPKKVVGSVVRASEARILNTNGTGANQRGVSKDRVPKKGAHGTDESTSTNRSIARTRARRGTKDTPGIPDVGAEEVQSARLEAHGGTAATPASQHRKKVVQGVARGPHSEHHGGIQKKHPTGDHRAHIEPENAAGEGEHGQGDEDRVHKPAKRVGKTDTSKALKVQAKDPAKPGRPSKYTDAIADKVCELLIDGLSMRQIGKLGSMPDRTTLLRWMEQRSDFAAKCARAREEQADLMDDLILETANACTSETAAADRVKISAYQWRAAKLKPKKYGDKLDITSDGKKIEAPTVVFQSNPDA